jgi:hypothetical protein
MTESHSQPPSDDELRTMFERFQGPDSPSPSPLRRRRRLGLSLALAVPLLAAAAVASVVVYGNRHEHSQATIVSSTKGSCPAKLKFEGRLYYGERLNPDDTFRRGELLGNGIFPDCSDVTATELDSNGTTITTHGNGGDDESANVFSVIGFSPADVVMAGGYDGYIFISGSVRDRISAKGCWNSGDYQTIFRCIGSS